jgi:CheY-like chemotaxis protein
MPETLKMAHGGEAPRIVAADDNVSVRELIALMLRSRGFDVVVASDGEAALAAILSDGADGLVSDVQMPGLDGLRLCRVLRGLRAYAALPIVVFTGLAEADPTLLSLRDISELRILHKPLGLHEIAPALREMIPTTATGFRVGLRAGADPRNASVGEGVAGARRVRCNTSSNDTDRTIDTIPRHGPSRREGGQQAGRQFNHDTR